MRRFGMILCVLLLLTGAVSASEGRASLGELRETLSEHARELMPSERSDLSGSFIDQTREVIAGALEPGFSGISSGAKTAWILLLIVILCATARNFCGEAASRAVTMAGTAAICLCFTGNLRSMTNLGVGVLDEYETFSMALFPAMAAATAGAGAPGTASAVYGVSVGFFHILIRLIRVVLLPLLFAYLAMSAVGAVLEENRLDGFRSLLGNAMKTILKILLFCFSAFLAVSGVTGAAVDATTLKAAKMTVSASVPVVGGMLNDATESVLSGAKILQNSVGMFGMLAILSIGIVPFLQMGIQYVFLQISCALCGVMGEPKLTGLVRNISGGMGYLLAMIAVCGALSFLSCVCFLRVSVS